jgi:hypothetical protein
MSPLRVATVSQPWECPVVLKAIGTFGPDEPAGALGGRLRGRVGSRVSSRLESKASSVRLRSGVVTRVFSRFLRTRGRSGYPIIWPVNVGAPRLAPVGRGARGRAFEAGVVTIAQCWI